MPIYLNSATEAYPIRISGSRSAMARSRRRALSAQIRSRGLGYVGAAAAETLPTASQYCGKNCGSQIFQSFLQEAISSRLLPAPTKQNASTDCSGGQVSNASGKATSIASTAIATGTTVAHVLAPALSAIPIVGTIAALFTGVLSGIFTHHAQAVQMQSNVICENVPAANQLLQQIDAELASGTATPSQASAAYQTILAQFTAAMKSDPSYKTGDALWGYVQGMTAVVAARNADLQAGVLTDGSPAPWTTETGAVASSLGIPPAALWIGAALFGLWLLT